MKKVVINDCFGGFSLSPAGERAYLARKGLECFQYVSDGAFNSHSYKRLGGDPDLIWFTFTKDHGDEFEGNGNFDDTYFSDRDIPRDDPELVAVVEEMGQDAAGCCAHLKIVKVPSDVAYQVEEYDGLEHIAEQHRTWS